jgi:hypothetical protein
MRKVFLCAFLLTVCLGAQPLDPVTSVPDEALASPATLGRFLAQDTRDDEEKARRIYRWIAGNIDYDAAGFRSGALGDNSAATVLRRRQAVCAGYSQLYKAMGDAAGLEVVVVAGKARGVSGPLSPHAWNAVKLHGQWWLLDATWGAGYLSPGGNYQRANTDFYFMTEPEKFVTEHLPDDSKWQLLPRPVEEGEYLTLSAQHPARNTASTVSPGAGGRKVGPATSPVAPPRLLSPRQLYSYGYRGARLIKPTAGTLPAGSQVFHLAAPGAEGVMVATDADSYSLVAVPGRLGEFKASVPLSAGKIRVLAKFGPSARYEPLLEYEVGAAAR